MRATRHDGLLLRMVALALACGSLGGPSSAYGAPFAYSVRSDADDRLYRIDLATGQATAIGAPLPSPSDADGLALHPVTGVLFAYDDASERLIRIDAATGAATQVGPSGLPIRDTGLTFDAAGNLFMSSDRVANNGGIFYSVNTQTGALTAIGPQGQPVTGLAWRNGIFYGLGGDRSDNLVTIDPATGIATVVGPLLNVTLVDGGIDFDANGTLWGLNDTGEIFTINTATGEATVVAQTLPGFESLAMEAQAPTVTLTVTTTGTGSGTVTASPPGTPCGLECRLFSSGAIVTLTANPGATSVFTGWSGAGCNGTGTCTVVMTQSLAVEATFTSAPTGMGQLRVAKAGPGVGSVVSAPAGIDCGSACTAGFPNGTVVTLTATSASGFLFAGWSGGGCSGTGPCAVTVGGAEVTVTATFTVPAGSFALRIEKGGLGSGMVTSIPAGIDCGTICAAVYPAATTVTLTPTPAAGSLFDGFAGDPECVDGVVTLTANTICAAVFLKMLTISPPSGSLVLQQGFDLVLLERAPGLTVLGRTATLDGAEVSAPLAACLRTGTLTDGSARTARCAGLTGALLGPGNHTVSITFQFTDGSTASDSVTWQVLTGAGTPGLTISPPSGIYITSQAFDLVVVVGGAAAVLGGTATFDGGDVTAALAGCVIPGALAGGGIAFRCPGLRGGFLGAGTHVLTVTVNLSDGSSATDTVVWEVRANTEP